MNTELPRPVVVGMPTGQGAEQPVRWAAQEARRQGAPLVVVHTYPGGSYGTPFAQWDPDAVRRAAISRSGRLADRMRRLFPGLTIATAVQAGWPATALEEYGSTARMIVIGRQHHGRIAEALLGSTAVEVATTVGCPVVAVPTIVPLPPDGAMVIAAVAHPRETRAVVGYALARAAAHHATLRVVHCWPAEGRYYQQHRLQAQDEMAHSTHLLTREFPDVPVQVTVIDGAPEHVLVRESCQASLMVLGPVGAGWPHRLGEVGRAVLRGAASPVVLLPPGAAAMAAAASRAEVVHSGR